MTVPNQRDPDGTQILRNVRGGLDDLKRTMISRWGRVPNLAADPASPPDGAVWLRSDLKEIRYQTNGITGRAATLGRVTNGSGFDTPTSGTTTLTAGATAATLMSAGRKYMARLELNDGWFGTVAADQFTITVQEDGVGLPGGGVPIYIIVANQYIPPGSLTEPFTTTTGSHTYRAAAVRNTGTGSLQFRGQLHIYDDGPV